jgi:ribonuclease HI
MPNPITIYSDGGADPNPGIGGWAVILRSGRHEKILTGNDLATTNNRMELTAAIKALEALKKPSSVEFYTDSEYVRKGITEWIDTWAERDWMSKSGKPVSNADLWRKLWPLVKKHDVQWQWVKAHAGNTLNERVDTLAREARMRITPPDHLPEDVQRLYVRGSCKGNPGPGGWGAVLVGDGESEQNSGSEALTTNNRMELQAVISGLLLVQPGSAVQVFTTSDYLYQGATRWIRGWRQRNWQKRDGQVIANDDLWQALDRLMQEYAIQWVNAEGQDLDDLEAAGKLAREARELA